MANFFLFLWFCRCFGASERVVVRLQPVLSLTNECSKVHPFNMKLNIWAARREELLEFFNFFIFSPSSFFVRALHCGLWAEKTMKNCFVQVCQSNREWERAQACESNGWWVIREKKSLFSSRLKIFRFFFFSIKKKKKVSTATKHHLRAHTSC